MSKKLRHRQALWYNTLTETIHYSKPPELVRKRCLYFPSTAEFNLYIALKSILPVSCSVEVQRYLRFSGIKWRIDFSLTGCESLLNNMASEFNSHLYRPVKPLDRLYIEYKGMKDKNFLHKQRLLATNPVLDYSVVLVGRTQDTLCYGKLYKKNIVGLQWFKQRLMELTNDD